MTFRLSSLLAKCFLVLFLISCARSDSSAGTKESIYTTCDFDLGNIESLLPHLPALCTEVYKNRDTDPDLYTAYLDESKAFGKFYKKLDDYELGPQHNQHEELQKYPFDQELRVDLYGKVNWADCVVSANNSATEYLNCVTNKHFELEQLVPSGGST